MVARKNHWVPWVNSSTIAIVSIMREYSGGKITLNRILLASTFTTFLLLSTHAVGLGYQQQQVNKEISNYQNISETWNLYKYPLKSIGLEGWFNSTQPIIYDRNNIYLYKNMNINPMNINVMSEKKVKNMFKTELENSRSVKDVHWAQLSRDDQKSIDYQIMHCPNSQWRIHPGQAIKWCYLSPDKKLRVWIITYSDLVVKKPYVDQVSVWVENVSNYRINCIGTLKISNFVQQLPSNITWLPNSERVSFFSNNMLCISPNLKQY